MPCACIFCLVYLEKYVKFVVVACSNELIILRNDVIALCVCLCVCVFFFPQRDFGTALESLLHFAFVLNRMANQLPLFSCCYSAILLPLFSGLRKVQNFSVHVTEAWICRVESLERFYGQRKPRFQKTRKLCVNGMR